MRLTPFPKQFRTLVRRINLLPIWHWGHVRVWNQRLRAPTFDRWLYLWLHRLGLMGRADRAFLNTHVMPGMAVVDIGANLGLYTLLFSQQVGTGGQVLAFEPDDRLYTSLQENIFTNHILNARTYHCALGAKNERMILYRSLLNSGDNRLGSNGRDHDPHEAVGTEVRTLDGVLADQRVDFIKLDVQGWELEVLRGMERLLDERWRTDLAIYFEYWPQGLMNAGSDPVELLRLLSGKRFFIYQVMHNKIQFIKNINAFASSVKPKTYLNLYATRRQTQ